MGPSNRSILDIVELVYYVPALVLSLLVIKKHGFGRQLGWIYLSILSLLRIIGSSTGIAANYKPSSGLTECAIITQAVGLSALLLAWYGMIKRVNDGLHSSQLAPKLLHFLHILILVGLVLAIYGGVKLFDSSSGSASNGLSYSKAAVIILLFVLIALSGFTIVIFATRIRHALDGERQIVFACLASIPFLLIRIIYSIIVYFDWGSSVFSFLSTRNAAVIVQAIMSVAMEFIVVTVYLAAGFAAPAIPRSIVQKDTTSAVSAQPAGSQGTPDAYPIGNYGYGQQTGVSAGGS